ncbi:MAG: hypothetical protein IPL39_01145 [Opitutaceae bacterium]|nr:hypothetical protein [Opitutaceae bacterium]
MTTRHRACFRLSILARCAGVLACLPLQGLLHAGPAEQVKPLDRTTVTVTDFTEAGREHPVASARAPVYYTGVNAGLRHYVGGVLAGDPSPDEATMLRVITQALADQGFKGADAQHPPTQIIVVSWGTIGGGGSLMGPGAGFGFLGGAKMNLSEESTISGRISGDVFKRRFRSGAAETVAQMAGDNLYAVLLRAYDMKPTETGKYVQLWETRMACRSPGTSLVKALPRLVVSGRDSIGRETSLPVVENATRTRRAWVELPEATVVEYIDATELTTARKAQRKGVAPAPVVPPSETK